MIAEEEKKSAQTRLPRSANSPGSYSAGSESGGAVLPRNDPLQKLHEMQPNAADSVVYEEEQKIAEPARLFVKARKSGIKTRTMR